MSRMVPRRAARSDASRAAIVAALRAIPECSVEDIGYPVDLLVGYQGNDFLMDCKTTSVQYNGQGRRFVSKGRVTDAQARFVREHRGSVVHFVSTPEEAVEVVMRSYSCGAKGA